MSYDEGNTWPVRQKVDTSFSGYSDLAVGKDGTVYCLYETNTVSKGFNYSLVLKRFTIDWIKKKSEVGCRPSHKAGRSDGY